MKKQCGVLAAVRTDIGKVRTENQDRILCSRAAEFFCGGGWNGRRFVWDAYSRISS